MEGPAGSSGGSAVGASEGRQPLTGPHLPPAAKAAKTQPKEKPPRRRPEQNKMKKPPCPQGTTAQENETSSFSCLALCVARQPAGHNALARATPFFSAPVGHNYAHAPTNPPPRRQPGNPPQKKRQEQINNCYVYLLLKILRRLYASISKSVLNARHCHAQFKGFLAILGEFFIFPLALVRF